MDETTPSPAELTTPTPIQVDAPSGTKVTTTTVATTDALPTGSPANSLNSVDWRQIAIVALYSVGGVLFTIFEQNIATISFGQYQIVFDAFNTVLVSAAHRFLTDNQA